MGKQFSRLEWSFVNMNSPSDLYCDYRGDGTIGLEEYDRCRNGHLLLSSFFVKTDICAFDVEVLNYQAGVGIGLYFGDGCFDHYVLIKAGDGSLEVRVPSGVPLGDTFRFEGGERHYTAACVPFDLEPPFKLGFMVEEQCISVFCNGRMLIKEARIKVPWIKPYARLLAMAVNETNAYPKALAELGQYEVRGITQGKELTGVCVDSLERPIPGVCLHVPEVKAYHCITDDSGCFNLGYLPKGTYEVVAGEEEKGFGHFTVHHTGAYCVWNLDTYWQTDSREPVPQGDLRNDLMVSSLNGVWRFSMDPEEKGELQQWYLPGQHVYDQKIRIPGSWQSLRAFGEEYLADGNSLHQASTFRCNWREDGRTAWMQREFSVDQDMVVQLVIGAISGIARIWLDGEELGCTVDFYKSYRYQLGYLETGRVYTVTVKIQYPFEGTQCCFGKQGFWFTDSPGIWQNVWLEEYKKADIRELLIDCQRRQDGSAVINGKAELVLTPEEEKELVWETGCRDGEWYIYGEMEPGKTYRFDFVYRASEGLERAELVYGKNSICVEFDATFGDAYDCISVYLQSDLRESAVCLKMVEEPESFLDIRKISYGEITLNYEIDLELDQTYHTCAALKVNKKNGLLEAPFELGAEVLEVWSPMSPAQSVLKADLYHISGGQRCILGSYTRCASIRTTGQKSAQDGTPYVEVNGEIQYIRGVLDQGYNPWGLYTYPSLEGDGPGSMLFDIKAAKACEYNMIRMHIKDNDPEWYTLCDREGMMVWDEVPSCFYGTWKDRLWRGLHYRRLKAMAHKHNYHPSVVICSVFNESWGISGDHERSPWDQMTAQEWIRASARIYKELSPKVLVLDNSGYGKTSQTEILDYHSYPVEFKDAFDFFGRLERQNFPGSVFNCYHEENRDLMKDETVRDLLQRNCRDNLTEIEFTGKNRQKGQPVLISEFVHTNEIERLIRIYRFAGYVRMNIASQENEDTSPLTAERSWRDFGYVHRDMSPAGYGQVNRSDYIVLARPWLTRVQPEETISVPVYAGVDCEECKAGRVRAYWSLSAVDAFGEWKSDLKQGEVDMELDRLSRNRPGEITVGMPAGMKGAWLFVWVSDGCHTICEHDVQFEIMGDHEPAFSATQWNPAEADEKIFSGFTGNYDRGGRHVFWAAGSGDVRYLLPVHHQGAGKKLLRLELSSCECLEGTRQTDETKFSSNVRISVNGILCAKLCIPDHPSDRRGLFSNSSVCEENITSYKNTGVYGYGYRYDIPVDIPEDGTEVVEVQIDTDQGGIVIYGNRMGRYGCDPMFLDGENETEESRYD